MQRILLIDAQSYCLKTEGLSELGVIIPAIGLMYIATYLKDKLKNSVEVKIVNRIVDCLSGEDLTDILKEYNPNIVGIRGMNIFVKQFHETAKVIKEFKKDIIVVGGGPYVTMDLEEAAEDNNVDYFVVGEGEITFTEMVEKLLNGQSPMDVKGVAYRDNGKITRNAPRPFIENLDSLPYPDYNLIAIDKYTRFAGYFGTHRRQAIIFSSRGCPYSCIYCHRIFGKKFRARSAQNVFREIEILHNSFGFKDFYFIDDTFNLDYQRAMDIFDLIIESKMKINLNFPNGLRGDIIDRLFIDKMVKAGTISIFYAIETASKRLQEFIKKNLNLEKLADNIHYTCEKGIMVCSSFMVGFPTETKEEALETIEYLRQFKKIVLPGFHSVRCYPNTEIYDSALRNGAKIEDIKDTYGGHYQDIMYSETPLISKSAFLEIKFKLLKEVFLSKERLLNAIEIQKKFLTKEEILDFYSLALKKKIENLEKDVLRFAT